MNLQQRVSLLVIPTIALVTWAGGYLVIWSMGRYYDAQARESALALARTVSLNLRRESDLSDARRLYSLIRLIQKNDHRVLGATIVDGTGEITGDLDEERVFSPATDPDLLAVLHGGGLEARTALRGPNVIEATVPIYYEGSGEVLGVFRLQYDMQSDNALYRRARWRIFFAVAGMAMLLALLLQLVVNHSVSSPLRVFTARAEALARGDLSARVPAQDTMELATLQHSFNEMAVRIEERTRQLLHAERLAAIGTLASGVAHEINNPLATILVCAEGLSKTLSMRPEELPPDGVEKLRTYLTLITDEARRCRGITAQLLDFSRRKVATMTPLDLRALIQDAVALTHPRAVSESKSFNLALDGDRLPVRGEPGALKQVLINLLINALDASSPGESVTVSSSRRGALACVEVIDRGRGLAADDLARVFEPFFTTKPSAQGTGLGLTICDLIMHQHGGSVRLQSAGPGQGVVATVTLPLAGQGSEAQG